MSSRGMGAINPSKMPNKRVIHRKDDPNDVDMYEKGGLTVQGPSAVGAVDSVGGLPKPKGPGNVAGKYSTVLPNELLSAKKKAQSVGDTSTVNEISNEESIRNKLKAFANGGLYDNINAKKKRIAAGSGEKMRKPGSKGAPTKQAFIKSAKTAKR